MSAFEFVVVLLAIILGLGISEVLGGWADQIRARTRLPAYPLQIAASALVLELSMQYLWLSWIFRDMDWTFPRFLMVAGPALALALAARVSKIDTSSGAPAAREQYFQASPAVFGLLAVFPTLVLFMSFLSDLPTFMADPPNKLAITVVRILVLVSYLGLAWSKSERFHWCAIGVVFLAAIGFVVRLGLSLSGPAA